MSNSFLDQMRADITGIRVMACGNHSVITARTTKERWLSWPWKPWVKTKSQIEPLCKDGDFIHDRVNNIIYCNERTIHELRKVKSL